MGDDLFRLLVDSVRDYAIFALDPKGNIRTWNAGAERLKGYRPSEIIGQNFSRFYPDIDIARGKPARELRVAAETGRFEDEGWRIRQDGSRFWANVVITALRDPKTGELVGFGKVTRDLTERRQSEEYLRESEEKFRLLVEGVNEYAIFLLDPEGFVQSWNSGAERLKGYRPGEIVGKHFSTFYPREEIEAGKPAKELLLAAANGQFEDEGWRIRKDGTRFWANVVISALRDARDGHIIGYSKVTRDLTERRRNEEKLQRAYRDMEAFSYSASHDLRAPLRAILSLAEITLAEEGAALAPDIRKNIQSIAQSAEKCARLVEDLLRFGRLTRQEIVKLPIDVIPVAQEIQKDLASRYAHKVDLRLPKHAEVRADPALFRIALENLLDNAWKFTTDATDPKVELGINDEADDATTLFVRDNGPGFEPRRAQDLFEPFKRLPTTARYEGTGVGLATVRRIIERHGGRVWAEGKQGEGATFFMSLPR